MELEELIDESSTLIFQSILLKSAAIAIRSDTDKEKLADSIGRFRVATARGSDKEDPEANVGLPKPSRASAVIWCLTQKTLNQMGDVVV